MFVIHFIIHKQKCCLLLIQTFHCNNVTPYTENIHLQFLWLIVEYTNVVYSYQRIFYSNTNPLPNNNMISSPTT